MAVLPPARDDASGRYVAAISEALVLYEDADVDSGLALIDNWGLIHALFHHSPVLTSRPRGWFLAEDRSLSELGPAPVYEELWRSASRTIVDLMVRARCRPVRRWAVRMLRRDPAASRAAVGIEDVLGLLDHDDAEVVEFAVEWLREADDLSSVPPERWLTVAEDGEPRRRGDPGRDHGAADRARADPDGNSRPAGRGPPLPLARLGLGWLKAKSPASDDERRTLLACSKPIASRSGPRSWRGCGSALSSTSAFHADWLLEFLDSRHADARAEGIVWFRHEPRAGDDVALWHRLLESPYDDVRLALATDLEARLKPAGGDVAGELSLTLSPGPAPAALGVGAAECESRESGQAGGRGASRASPGPTARGGRGAAAAAGGGDAIAPGSRAPRGPGRSGATRRESSRVGADRPGGPSRVAMGLTVCDHGPTFDSEGGRAGARDQRAAAIRRGRT